MHENDLQKQKNRRSVHVYMPAKVQRRLVRLAARHHRSLSAEIQTLIDTEYARLFPPEEE